MPEMQTLLTGLAFGESPRWHDGRLWVADWGAQEILAVTLEGKREVIVKVSFPSFPMCFDWLPDGHFLLVSEPAGAAAKLGIPSTTLESKIKSLKINKHHFKNS